MIQYSSDSYYNSIIPISVSSEEHNSIKKSALKSNVVHVRRGKWVVNQSLIFEKKRISSLYCEKNLNAAKPEQSRGLGGNIDCKARTKTLHNIRKSFPT